MEPFEIIAFSRVSSVSQYIAKLCSRLRPPLKVILSLFTYPEISIEIGKHDYITYHLTPEKEKDGFREKETWYYEKYDIIYIYADDMVQKWMDTFDYMKTILNVEIKDFNFWMDQFENKRIITWMKSHGPSVPQIEIAGENVSIADIEFLLQSIKITYQLELNVKTTERSSYCNSR